MDNQENIIKDVSREKVIKEIFGDVFIQLNSGRVLDVEKILKDPGLLHQIKKALDVVIAGEDRNKLLLFLIMLSKELDTSMHAILTGPSSVGKSYLANSVASCFPEEDVKKYSRITPATLDWMKDNLKHKILFIQQLGGAQSREDTLHVMLSEKGLILGTVKRTQGGLFEPYEVTVEGPLCFISTVLENINVDEQLLTRSWLIVPDESEEQTRKVQEFQAELFRNPYKKKEIQIVREVIREIIQKLKGNNVRDVVIPFSHLIEFPASKVRTRRDFEKLLLLTGAVAYLYQYQRPIVEIEGKKCVVAFPADFFMAKIIAEESFETTIAEFTPKLKKVLEICRQIEKNGGEITAKEVARRSDFSQWTAKRCLRKLVDLGILVIEQEHSGPRPDVYGFRNKEGKLSTVELHINLNLSDENELTKIYNLVVQAEQYDKEKLISYINPLSGCSTCTTKSENYVEPKTGDKKQKLSCTTMLNFYDFSNIKQLLYNFIKNYGPVTLDRVSEFLEKKDVHGEEKYKLLDVLIREGKVKQVEDKIGNILFTISDTPNSTVENSGPQSSTVEKICRNCKHFIPSKGLDVGKCLLKKRTVSETDICNKFELDPYSNPSKEDVIGHRIL